MIKNFILIPFAWILIRVFAIFLLPYSIYISIKYGVLSHWFYEIARGLDILANKIYSPAFNVLFVKDLGEPYGGDETISQCMARNKFDKKKDTKLAKDVEKIINLFDKQHLAKTYKKLPK